MTIQFTTWINENEVVVSGTYRPSHPGSRNRYGAPESPDDPEQIDDIKVTDVAGELVEVSELTLQFYEQRLLKEARSAKAQAVDEKYNWPPRI